MQGLHSASIPGILSLDVNNSDTSKILTGGNDRNATVFNKDTEQVVAILKGHTKKVTRVIYHPDEVRIVYLALPYSCPHPENLTSLCCFRTLSSQHLQTPPFGFGMYLSLKQHHCYVFMMALSLGYLFTPLVTMYSLRQLTNTGLSLTYVLADFSLRQAACSEFYCLYIMITKSHVFYVFLNIRYSAGYRSSFNWAHNCTVPPGWFDFWHWYC